MSRIPKKNKGRPTGPPAGEHSSADDEADLEILATSLETWWWPTEPAGGSFDLWERLRHIEDEIQSTCRSRGWPADWGKIPEWRERKSPPIRDVKAIYQAHHALRAVDQLRQCVAAGDAEGSANAALRVAVYLSSEVALWRQTRIVRQEAGRRSAPKAHLARRVSTARRLAEDRDTYLTLRRSDRPRREVVDLLLKNHPTIKNRERFTRWLGVAKLERQIRAQNPAAKKRGPRASNPPKQEPTA